MTKYLHSYAIFLILLGTNVPCTASTADEVFKIRDTIAGIPTAINDGVNALKAIPGQLAEPAQKLEEGLKKIQETLRGLAQKKIDIENKLNDPALSRIKEIKTLKTSLSAGIDALNAALCSLARPCDNPALCPTKAANPCLFKVFSVDEFTPLQVLQEQNPGLEYVAESINDSASNSDFNPFGKKPKRKKEFIFRDNQACGNSICACTPEGSCSPNENALTASNYAIVTPGSTVPIDLGKKMETLKLPKTACLGSMCDLARTFKESELFIKDKTASIGANELVNLKKLIPPTVTFLNDIASFLKVLNI